MKVAVLGVGLIGGSIGLAARSRLGAEVAGFDPDRGVIERALELEAISESAETPEEACSNADLVFCAAPVGSLPELTRWALGATGQDAIVTDVGSTKRELVAGLGKEPRFVGGHPLAGAETAGVENARADLFEGAAWYLTPTEVTEGILYDRLQRTLADLGARPAAIEASAHDRLMATVSHLPHVIANVLAAQAADRFGGDSERLPDVGPSLRDTTRVAGANPEIWKDIFTTNSDAVADEIDAVVERLREAASLLRGGDPEAVADWHSGAGAGRRQLLEAELCGRPAARDADPRPEPPGDRRRAGARLWRGRCQYRGYGAVPGRRHALRRDHDLGRGRRASIARRAPGRGPRR